MLGFKGAYNLEEIFSSAHKILVISYSKDNLQAILNRIIERQARGKITVILRSDNGKVQIRNNSCGETSDVAVSEILDRLEGGWLLVVDDITLFITEEMTDKFLNTINNYSRFLGGCKYPVENNLQEGLRRVAMYMDVVLFIPYEVHLEV